MCTPRPQVCPDVFLPVCGCNGLTYGNACEAQVAGVDVASMGACANPVTCTLDGRQCGSGEYCAVADGSCTTAGVTGACSQLPQACPLVVAPVCGCDGRTYGNKCEAAAAGVNVSAVGACQGAATCTTNRDCADGTFCNWPMPTACGAGGSAGTCSPRPTVCPDIYAPVCGCDGNTYGNACAAAAAGAAVASDGTCVGAVACSASTDTCGTGQYCDYTPNSCGAGGAMGACAEVPLVCPLVFRPVCGCDGSTYGNTCEAARAGVDVASDGACVTATACGGRLGTCAPGEFCDWEPNSCGAADESGTCRPMPRGCADVFAPVCGCDGNTYGNSCMAAAAGVDVASVGACANAVVCGGLLGTACPATQFCDYEPNSCGAADQQGLCRLKPQACTGLYAPVCGCDGHTYGNACQAQSAGTDVAFDGACQAATTCTVAGGCGALDYCDWADRSCGAGGTTGTCSVRPTLCPNVWAPVCGCNGRTYGNTCEAAAAGVDVASDGACANPMSCMDTAACGVGNYCNYEPNTCGSGGVGGTCEVRPRVCPLVVAPVCGCDGNTYGNLCEAASAGVDIVHTGACNQARLCGGFLGAVCGAAEYCDYTPDSCGAADQQGVCSPKPQVCDGVVAPVCACNGMTYSNACNAAAAGFDVSTRGPCL